MSQFFTAIVSRSKPANCTSRLPLLLKGALQVFTRWLWIDFNKSEL